MQQPRGCIWELFAWPKTYPRLSSEAVLVAIDWFPHRVAIL